MTDVESIQFEGLKKLVRDAMFYAKDAHTQVFKTNNLVAAIGFLNCACSKMSAAQALYFSCYDPFGHDDLDVLFKQFDEFCHELLTDFATDHSQQWTDIEYQRLKDDFDRSLCAFEN